MASDSIATASTTDRFKWDPPTEGWVVKQIHKHLWRVQPDMEFEDLFNEAYRVWLYCRKKYPDVENLMPLFMRSFANELNALSTNQTKHRHAPAVSHFDGEDRVVEHSVANLMLNDAEVRMLVEEDAILFCLVRHLVDAELKPRPRRTRRKGRQTTEDFVNSILPPEVRVDGIYDYVKAVLKGEVPVVRRT